MHHSHTLTHPHPHTSQWLVAIIGFHLALGLVYDWATPIFEAPDEGYHFAVIHWIGQGNGLPVQRVGEKAEWAQEGSQPPLFHLLAAGLTSWLDMSDWQDTFVANPLSRIGRPDTTHNVNLYRHTADQVFPYHGTTLAVHVVRWFTLGLSALTIFLTYRLALTVFPPLEGVALLAAVLAALNPKAIFINASANNDNLLMLLSTAALLVVVHSMQPAVKHYAWKAAGLGLLLGLAALTKVSGLVVWPVAALGVGWGAWRARDARRFVLSGAILAGVALLVSGWWFWRNQVLYGEWLGLSTMIAVAGPRAPAISLLELIRQEWRGFFLSYWSVFGIFTILPAPWVHAFFDILTLWALVGGAWALFKRRAWPRPELMLLGLFCGLTLVGVIRWTLQTFASQGRLMFGAIAPLSIFMAAGLLAPLEARLSPRITSDFRLRTSRFQFGIWDLGFGILFFALALVAVIIPVVYIAPRYAPPRAIAETDLPHDLRAEHVKFGEGIELIGYTVDGRPRAPGESQPVTLYWRALKPMTADYAVALHLLGREAAEVGKIDTWPGGGNAPTSQWRPGAIFADTYFLPIDPQAAAPSLLKLDLYFWEGEAAKALPQTTLAGEALKSVNFVVGRIAPKPSPAFAPASVEGSYFEYGIALLGLDASVEGALRVRVVLYWRTEQPIPGDYTVFVHLTDANGLSVTTPADAPPLNGDWPTSAWIPGQAFADTRLFALPPNLAPGRYSLQLGFYDPSSGARLTAFHQDGTEWRDGIVMIKDVIEIK